LSDSKLGSSLAEVRRFTYCQKIPEMPEFHYNFALYRKGMLRRRNTVLARPRVEPMS
jgi:hypothetical protein